MLPTEALSQALGISFRNPSLLEEALTHTSYLNENPGLGLAANERLEFLGDALLSLVVAAELFRRFPAASEGELTQMRSALVRRETLARLAASLSLGDCLRLGQGEEATGGRQRPSNLARALEAVLGAVLLDRGWIAARRVVLRLWHQELRAVRPSPDHKSRLQAVLQARERLTPHYRTLRERSPSGEPLFEVEVVAGERVLGRGSGASKKQAQQAAAREALARLGEAP